MPTTSAYHYACGCVCYPDWTWNLCDDCSSRIGAYGTCLQCGDPADERWVSSEVPDETFCSERCAVAATHDVLWDRANPA